jgi:transcription initiation factor TFIID subunit 5
MDRSLRVWTTEKETPVRLMAGHYADVDCCRFHPNSNYIATGSADRCVRLWDMLDGKCVRTLTGHRASICTIAWSHSSGRYLATGDIGGHVLFWDMSKTTKSDETLIARFVIDELKTTVKIAIQHHQITALTFSRCGNILTAGTVKESARRILIISPKNMCIEFFNR